MRKNLRAPLYLFTQQKTRAAARGIDWELTLADWLDLWGERLPERGRGSSDLCMARIADVGPYARGNVYITTNAQNNKDKRPKVLRHTGLVATLKLTGRGRGWSFFPDTYPLKPYRVYAGKKFVGNFETQADAESAYAAACAAHIESRCGALRVGP